MGESSILNIRDDPSFFNEDMDSLLNNEILLDEVQKGINKLKVGKAHGKDGIGAEFYKSTIYEISPLLVLLFNKILNTGVFPDSWCDSVIIPIFKSGSKADPNNYRGISLLNVLYKIFSSIINDRLTRWSVEFNILDECQSGFRAGYSAIDNSFCLQSMIQKYLSRKGGRFYVLYVDFQKAFDTLNHTKLFTCLNKKGIQGNLFRILVSMYANIRAHVKVDSKLTPSILCNTGLKQGDLSSPIIFNIYINELSKIIRETCRGGIFITPDIPNIFCLMFADDVANCADSVINLQLQLNTIDSFCKETGMIVNLKKSEIIVFRNGGPLRHNEKWTYRKNRIRVTSTYKFMGLIFTPKLSWSSATKKLANQARKSVYQIKQFQSHFGKFMHNDYFKIFDSMVTPILTYGAELWGFECNKHIEQVHSKFCKDFLGVNTFVNDSMALGECGRFPIAVNYHMKFVRYWVRLIEMENHRYPKQCYLMLKTQDSVGRNNWVTKVREFLFSQGFGFIWISQEIGDSNQFCKLFKQRVTDCSLQTWHSDISNSTRCDFYRNFKSLLNVERYINSDIKPYYKRALARFRCSSHKLNIEIGRHFNVDRNDRVCLYCFLNKDILIVEDEYHAFFICEKFGDIRHIYLYNWYKARPNLDNFYNLFKCNDEITLKNLAFFVSKLLEHIST
jgi:hypothetical protein